MPAGKTGTRCVLSVFISGYLRQLQECKNEEQILNQVMQVIRQFQKKTKNEKKHSSYEEKAVLYMEQNYMNDISLDEVRIM